VANEHIDDLRNALAQVLVEGHYDPESYEPDQIRIRGLVGAVREFDVGDIDITELQTIFKSEKVAGFDLDLWLLKMADQGFYTSDVLEAD
jgi:hypothetical protein